MLHDQTLHFGPYRLTGPHGPLWQDTKVVPLPPKALAVLWELARQAGTVITKEALLTLAWGGTSAHEGVLTACLRTLRRALGEDARQPRYIATVHRLGYRFVALVNALAPQPSAQRWVAPAACPSAVPSRPTLPFLAGREAEIARLHSCLTQALHGRRQIILLPGEAGIGKTALVDTFLHQLESPETLWVGRGQCIEQHGEGEAYLPFLDALGRLGRAPRGERLVACLRQYAPTWLAQLPTLCPPSERDTRHDAACGMTRARMLRELTEALEELSRECPVVLVLEDLHWSDPATMEALALLARRRDAARLLVLGTYRQRELMLHNHPFQGVTQELVVHGLVGEVPLGPLPHDAVAAYLVQYGVAPEPESDVVTWVYRRTEGHPLFLVHVVEHLARQGLFHSVKPMVVRGAEVGNTEAVAIMQAVPPGVQRLLAAHMGRLAPAEQAVLEAGSVAGTMFTAANVAMALQMPAAAVEKMCESLARRGQFLEDRGLVLQRDGTASGRYGFRYALYREAIYKRLSAGRRERLHLLIEGRAEAVPHQRLLQRLS